MSKWDTWDTTVFSFVSLISILSLITGFLTVDIVFSKKVEYEGIVENIFQESNYDRFNSSFKRIIVIKTFDRETFVVRGTLETTAHLNIGDRIRFYERIGRISKNRVKAEIIK
jgi:hypothetical protein